MFRYLALTLPCQIRLLWLFAKSCIIPLKTQGQILLLIICWLTGIQTDGLQRPGIFLFLYFVREKGCVEVCMVRHVWKEKKIIKKKQTNTKQVDNYRELRDKPLYLVNRSRASISWYYANVAASECQHGGTSSRALKPTNKRARCCAMHTNQPAAHWQGTLLSGVARWSGAGVAPSACGFGLVNFSLASLYNQEPVDAGFVFSFFSFFFLL